MLRTIEMFPDLTPSPAPRARRRVMAHIIDAGCNFPDGQERGVFQCKCGWVSDWTVIESIAKGRRGIPCEKCNSTDRVEKDNND